MAIGYVIKKLRRERDITQEQLADMLGITSRAVSQWECGRASPDISQLPILSNIFGVSADVLLEIDVTQKEKRIDEILKEAESHWSKGYNSDGAKILREGLKEFPNSYKIMFNLMSCLWRVRDEPENAEKRDEMTAEVISIGEKILSECTDTNLRYSAVQLLCYTYPGAGEEEKAIRLANELPDLTKSDMLVSIYRGTKMFDLKRDMLHSFISDLYLKLHFYNTALDGGSMAFTTEEEIEIFKKYFAIMEILFEDGNYGFFRQEIGWSYISLAKLYMKVNGQDKAIECLKTASEQLIINDTTYDPDSEYTCLLLRGKKFGRVLHNIDHNDTMYQLGEMEDSVFDPIRESAEFISIENELKKYAKKH